MAMPTIRAGTSDRTGFLGTIFSRRSSLTKTWTSDETATPRRRKGVASTRIPIKIEIQS
jgi:hypothetical protein